MSNKNSVTELWIMSLLTLCSVFLKKKRGKTSSSLYLVLQLNLQAILWRWSDLIFLRVTPQIVLNWGGSWRPCVTDKTRGWSDLIPVTMIFLHVILQLILNWGPCVTGNSMVVRSDSSRSSCCLAAQGNLTGVPAFLVSGQQIWGKSRSWNY